MSLLKESLGMNSVMNRKRVRTLVYAILLGLACGPAGSALAADSSCKGVSKSECESKGACVWVDGYTTKKGTKVSAYCRVKSSKARSGGQAKKSGKAPGGDKTTKETKTEKKTAGS
jgi:hypothetical protein